MIITIVKGEGNVTPSGEFNFYSDPEAAHIVLNSLGCPITLTCWELCEQYALTWVCLFYYYHEYLNDTRVKEKYSHVLEVYLKYSKIVVFRLTLTQNVDLYLCRGKDILRQYIIFLLSFNKLKILKYL